MKYVAGVFEVAEKQYADKLIQDELPLPLREKFHHCKERMTNHFKIKTCNDALTVILETMNAITFLRHAYW